MSAEIEFRVSTPAAVPDTATEYMVAMRDGVRLATDVYLSGDGAVAPTVLVRLPYDKDGDYTFMPLIAEYITARGYHMVVQDVRGKFRSEGVGILFMNEVNDGYDTIDWVAGQEWSDGSVVMFGDSYYGFTQWAAAQSGHPALKAISPRVTGTGVGHRPVTTESGPQEVEAGLTLEYIVTVFLDQNMYEWAPNWTSLPLIDQINQFQETVGHRSPSLDLAYPEYKLAGRFNGDPNFSGKPLPTLHTIGWWDNCAPWSWQDQKWITADPEWATHSYLLIESIDHENIQFGNELDGREQTLAEILDMLPRYLDPSLEFYDAVLNGRLNKVPRVRWNLAHTDGHRTSEAWPPPAAQPVALSLTAAGTLDAEAGPTAKITWVHNPDDLIPSSTPNSFAYLQYSPDDRALADRDDVLAFTASAVDTDLILAGPVQLDARVEADNDDFHVFARLYDRSPDGRLTRIAWGQTRMRGASGPVQVCVDLLHVGYLLQAGHALELHVQSSDYPDLLFSTGTDKDPWQEAHPRPIRHAIAVGHPDTVLTVHTLDDPGPAI
jgi:putative CocE/NonD family hydrolase